MTTTILLKPRDAQRRKRAQRTAETLTHAQRRVFELLLGGESAAAIASRLGLSVFTVNNHTRAIFSAFEVCSRAELMAAFVVPTP